MSRQSKSNTCAKCGGSLSSRQSWCGDCGTPRRDKPREIRANPLALAVFGLLFALGGLGVYRLNPPPPSQQRAVSGAPGATRPTASSPALDLAPADHPMVELPEEVTRVLDRLSEAAEASPDDLESWLILSRARYRAGLIDPSYVEKARQALGHVLELDADSREAIRMYGNLEYNARQFVRAEELFNRYLQIDPDDAAVRTDLGSSLLFQERREEARDTYREVTEKTPGFMQAWFNLGLVQNGMGDREGALASLKKAGAIAKDPEQKRRVETLVASLESLQAAGPTPRSSRTGGGSAAATAGGGKAESNASSDFQRGADRLLLDHRIVGPRVVAISWSSDSLAEVKLNNFPMDNMPPVVRNRFKSRINEALASLAEKSSLDDAINIALVDSESGLTMDKLDGIELVGAFDQPEDLP
ncbi:MAG TPA: tetratricopeptide repeat protein [Deltaproteobacteria bacterium]|nr:tetratricopeptide repeat protein [Candidatus Binatota bacterium]HIL13015.1 tetratricopeptide repeat protein [Deltaproteobacteria bacterium]